MSGKERLSLAQEILKANRSHVDGAVTSFGGLRPNKVFTQTPVLALNVECLGRLNSGDINYQGLETFFIFNQASMIVPDHQRFLNWILSPDASPWRSLIRAQSYQDRDFINKYGYVLDNLNFASNYVVNFLTAFRAPLEKPGCIKMWDDLVHDGVSPGCAIWMVGSCAINYAGKTEDKERHLNFVNDPGHYAFSPGLNGFDAPERITKGNPCEEIFTKHKFNQNTEYTPCNAIWSDKVKKEYTLHWDINKKIQQFAKSLNKSGSVKRVFPNPTQREIPITYPILVEFCKTLDRKEIQ